MLRTRNHSNVTSLSRFMLPMILGLALLIRLVVVHYYGNIALDGDEVTYHQMALNILEGNGPKISDTLVAWRLPMAGYYVAALYGILGVSVKAVQLVNVVISVLTVLLVYDLARLLFGLPAAYWSGLLVATYPSFSYYAGVYPLLSETLMLFLLSLALWLTWWTHSRSPLCLIMTGIIWGTLVLTHPQMVPVAGLAILWIVTNRMWTPFWFQRIIRASIVSFLIFMFLIPWVVRNRNLTGEFVPLTTQSGYALWIANNPKADGVGAVDLTVQVSEFSLLSEVERSSAYHQIAIRYISENPISFVWLSLKRIWFFWHLGYHGGGLKEVAFLIGYLPLLVLGLSGSVIAWKTNRSGTVLLAIVPISGTIVHSIFLPEGRYRLPSELILSIFGGISFSLLFKYFLSKRSNRREYDD